MSAPARAAAASIRTMDADMRAASQASAALNRDLAAQERATRGVAAASRAASAALNRDLAGQERMRLRGVAAAARAERATLRAATAERRASADVSAALNRDLAGQERAHARGLRAQQAHQRYLDRPSAAGNFARGVAGGALRLGAGLAMAGAGGLLVLGQQLVSIGREAQNTRLALSDAFSASGSGGGWDRSMTLAAGAMARIRRDAAALPGEAQEYVQVFQAALPAALASGMRHTNDIVDLTDAVAAIGRMRGIDAPQIGRDLSLMLRGRAGLNVNTFSQMLPQLQQAATARGLHVSNAQQFNRLSAAQRVQVIQGAAGMHGDALRAANATFEAQWGTLMSSVHDAGERLAGPVLERVTRGLSNFNAALSGPTGRRIEAAIGGLVDGGMRVAGDLWPAITEAGQTLGPPLLQLAAGIEPHVGPLVRGFRDLAGAASHVAVPVVQSFGPAVTGILGALGPLASGLAFMAPLIGGYLRTVFTPLRLAGEAATAIAEHFQAAAANTRSNEALDRAQAGANDQAIGIQMLSASFGNETADRLIRGLNAEGIGALAETLRQGMIGGLGAQFIRGNVEAEAYRQRAAGHTVGSGNVLGNLAAGAGGALTVHNNITQNIGPGVDADAVGQATQDGAASGTRTAVARGQRGAAAR